VPGPGATPALAPGRGVRYLCGVQDSLLGRLIVRAAMLTENVVQLVLLAVLRMRGRHHPLIVPFVGHGTPGRIRVHARVLLGRREETEVQATGVPGAPAPTGRSQRALLRASLARFLTVEVSKAPVRVTVGEQVVQGRADREGYFDLVVELDEELEPGWHEVELALSDGTTVIEKVVVVDPAARIGVVSDVDDTILETGLTRGLAFIRATLLTEVGDRSPLPGAAALYTALTQQPGEPTRPVFYVSTSPWNLHEMLLEFIALRRFPLGPLQLTDWGPSRQGLLRIAATEHKTSLVRRMLDEHPQLKLVLIGDSGQLDPEIYAALARENPDRIAAVYIRRTAHDAEARIGQVNRLAAEVTALGVPMLAVNDSVEIAAHAAALGLLDASALPAVRDGVKSAPAHLRS
jgi:phosphatidate phosphatase APP1